MTKRLLAIFLATFALAGGTASAGKGRDPGPTPQPTPTPVQDAATLQAMGNGSPNYVPIALPAKVFKRTFNALKPAEKAAMVQRIGMKRMALEMRRDYLSTLNKNFEHSIPREKLDDHIHDQQQSGRCWIFGTKEVIESGLVARDAKPQDLSASFANYHAWQTKARDLLTKAVKGKGDINFGDFGEGGYFTWAAQTIGKYGMVPDSAMPDTADGANTDAVISQMKHIIAGAQSDADRIKGTDAKANHARAEIKKSSMKQITDLLNLTFGKPPAHFKVDGKKYTPQTYAKEVLKFDPNGFVVLTNNTGSKMAYNKGYKQPAENGFKGFPLYNVSEATMEQAIRSTIDKGYGVAFATQVGSENPYITDNSAYLPEGARRIMNIKAFDYNSIFPTKDFSKRARLNTGLEQSNHEMMIVGYDKDKYNVDNSWGTSPGYPQLGVPAWDGHMTMYRDFFRRFGDEIAVPKFALSADFLKKLESSKLSKLPQ